MINKETQQHVDQILTQETNEFHDDIQDSPELKAALYQVIL